MHALNKLHIAARNAGTCLGPNAWIEAEGHAPFESINPATGQVIASVVPTLAHEYDQVLAMSHAAFLRWREVPAPLRGQVVRRFGDLLREHKDALGTLVAMEVGKIKAEGDGEVQEMIDMADLAVGQSRMLYGNSMHSERARHRMMEQWQPLGPIAVISAFNFPVAVWAWNAFLGAICGDTVIWKPSPKAPLTAIAVQHIANQVMEEFDCPGVFTLMIPTDNTIAEKLVADVRVPLVSFTGSSAVGKRVAQVVAHRLGRYLLECSGNNAIIVDETADLKLAIPAIVFGSVGTAGQRCTTTRRLIVHRSLVDHITTRLASAYAQVRIGDPLDAATLMGPLIDQHAVDNFVRAVAAAREAGGTVVCGGKVIERAGHYVEPTIIRIDAKAPVLQHETFAPILYLMAYDTLEEAIAIQNGVPQGLSSAIFTERVSSAEAFLAATGSDCGIANVNLGTSGAEIGGAFGGEKETGGGREAGSDSWKAYMRRQTSTVNWSGGMALAQGIKFDL